MLIILIRFATSDNSYYEKFLATGEVKCIDEEIPFEIPKGWEWERWGNIALSIQYGYNAPALERGDIKMVRISDIHDNVVQWENVPFCNIEAYDIDTYLLKENDILFRYDKRQIPPAFEMRKQGLSYRKCFFASFRKEGSAVFENEHHKSLINLK